MEFHHEGSGTGFRTTLPRSDAAAFHAREAVRARLGDQLPEETLSDLTLAVSELATNAVVHGRGKIELQLEVDHAVVKGAVVDEGGGFAYDLEVQGLRQQGGKGLFLVAGLASSWGVHEGSTHVWFEMPIAGDAAGLAEPRARPWRT